MAFQGLSVNNDGSVPFVCMLILSKRNVIPQTKLRMSRKRPDDGGVVGRTNLQPCGSLSRHTQETPQPLPT
jgi:hypothetical protein